METLTREDILSRVDALALKLNTSAEHLFQILITQARIEVFQSTFVWLVLSLTFLLTLRKVAKYTDWKDTMPMSQFVTTFICIGSGIFAVLTTFILIQMVPTNLMNPEYYALKEIGRFIGR